MDAALKTSNTKVHKGSSLKINDEVYTYMIVVVPRAMYVEYCQANSMLNKIYSWLVSTCHPESTC